MTQTLEIRTSTYESTVYKSVVTLYVSYANNKDGVNNIYCRAVDSAVNAVKKRYVWHGDQII